jgi:tetratricopeptide (TPR) repeat protein
MPRKRSILILLAAAIVCGAASSSFSQSAKPEDSPKAKPNKQTDTAAKSADDQPKWDPYRAEKDIEVGQYYMKNGRFDAAIDRFTDAIEAKPGYAPPFRYLGEAQEKKGMKRDAVKSYKRYLELYPHAEDKEKIEKKIEKLRSQLKENTNAKGSV